MKKVNVFAPASIANLGCGFDIMGLALDEVGDVLEMSVRDGDGLTIVNRSGVPLPEDPEQNVITPVIRKFMELTGNRAQVDVVIREKIFPGSGIGSSSASSAAAAFGINELFGAPLSEEEVVLCAMEGENLASGGYHADNAAPAVMGGIVLIRGYEPLDLIKLPVPGDFYCAVLHPHLVVSTKEALSALAGTEEPRDKHVIVGFKSPDDMLFRDDLKTWAEKLDLILTVDGAPEGYAGNIGLVGRSMRDAIAEPYRKGFIPGFDELREKVLQSGSLAMNIAGSGPSVFALADRREKARKAGEIFEQHFAARGIDYHSYVVKVSNRGARLIAY